MAEAGPLNEGRAHHLPVWLQQRHSPPLPLFQVGDVHRRDLLDEDGSRVSLDLDQSVLLLPLAQFRHQAVVGIAAAREFEVNPSLFGQCGHFDAQFL